MPPRWRRYGPTLHILNWKDNMRELFVRFCKILYDRELVGGVGGNIAMRDHDHILVTPTNRSLGHLEPNDVVVVDSDGQPIGPGKPSKELNMHLAVLRHHPEATVVCHAHGPYIVAASALLEPGDDSLPPLTPGYTCYAYPMPMVPFALPGSTELADMVEEKMKGRRAVLLQNHGLVTVGATWEEALNIAEEIDESARVFVLTHGQARPITEEMRALIR